VFIALHVMAVTVTVRAVMRGAAECGHGFLRGDSGCAHGAGFPLGSQPIRAHSLIRELSDGKSFFLDWESVFVDLGVRGGAKIVRFAPFATATLIR
jgi:hypothetical protein